MTLETSGQEEIPQTLRQRLMPQASIRSLIALSAICAVIMWLIRQMLIGDYFWAKCIGAILVTIAGCFVAYALLFLLAHLFTVVTSPIVDAIEKTPADHRQRFGATPDQAHEELGA